MICKAGSIAVFSSMTLHMSPDNVSQNSRRAINTQYTRAPLYLEDGVTLRHKAVPFFLRSDGDENGAGRLSKEAVELREIGAQAMSQQ